MRTLRAGANGSSTTPPASVCWADWSRRMKRSPRNAPMGWSSTICARPLAPGSMPVRFQQRDAPHHIRRAEMHVHRGPVPERARRGWRQLERHIEARGRCVRGGLQYPVAARDVLLLDAGEVERAALARQAALGRAVLRVDAAHPHFPAGRRHQQAVAHAHAAGKHRAGHHRAAAGKREATVHGETETAVAPRLPAATRPRPRDARAAPARRRR